MMPATFSSVSPCLTRSTLSRRGGWGRGDEAVIASSAVAIHNVVTDEETYLSKQGGRDEVAQEGSERGIWVSAVSVPPGLKFS